MGGVPVAYSWKAFIISGPSYTLTCSWNADHHKVMTAAEIIKAFHEYATGSSGYYNGNNPRSPLPCPECDGNLEKSSIWVHAKCPKCEYNGWIDCAKSGRIALAYHSAHDKMINDGWRGYRIQILDGKRKECKASGVFTKGQIEADKVKNA